MSKNTKPKPARVRARFHELWYFVGTVIYMELLLQILGKWSLSFPRFAVTLLFSVSYGAVLAALASVLSSWRGKRAVLCPLLAILGVLFSLEYFLATSYQTYMPLSSVVTGGGNVAAEFLSVVFSLILRRFWVIVLFELPTLLYGLFGNVRLPFGAKTLLRTAVCLLLAAATFFLAVFLVNGSIDKGKYHEEFHFDAACRTFGLITALRLDLTQDKNEAELSFQTVEPDPEPEPEPEPAPAPVPEEVPEETPEEVTEEPEAPEDIPEEPEEPEKPARTHNEMDIDFAALAEEASDPTIAGLHAFVASQKPAATNDYTGLFEGKNLIFITAEAFSKEVIDPKLTPTLYRMANKGIVFDDYYQPAWGGSTSTGEYSNLVGLIPTDGVRSIQDTIGHNMYFTLGNQLQRLDYYSAAYHDGTYDYYGRNKTHCNLGYSSWMGLGNGMEEGVQELWPESDLEMIDFTVPKFIDKQPFSIYYMSVSGHGNYLSGNDMADKNYEAVKDLDRTEAVKRYLAANLELEYAMESLIRQLEKADIADDTVIVLATDHYPYGLEKSETWGNYQNYLTDLYGYEPKLNTEQDHSALIIWSGCLEEMDKIEVKTPVYSLDIVPTLSNLFGLEYDSRLLVGRDALSYSQPLVIWPDHSWLTDKGYFSASSGSFTPNEDADVTSAYVERIKSIVANKFTFSRGVLQSDYYAALFGEDDIE